MLERRGQSTKMLLLPLALPNFTRISVSVISEMGAEGSERALKEDGEGSDQPNGKPPTNTFLEYFSVILFIWFCLAVLTSCDRDS